MSKRVNDNTAGEYFWKCDCMPESNNAIGRTTCRTCGKPRHASQDAQQGGLTGNGGPVDAGQAKAAKSGVSRESQLQRDCETWLRLHGIEYLHLSLKAREKPGWPDLTFAIDGKACGVELKTATGTLNAAQKELHPLLQANGWRVAVCRSVEQLREFCEGVRHD